MADAEQKVSDNVPMLRTDFQQGGMSGIALLGPGGSKPDLPIDGLNLSVGLHVYLFEKDADGDGKPGYLHVDGIVAGWNERYQCWFATYDSDALKWTPGLDGFADPIPFDEWARRVFAHEVKDQSWWWNEETDWNDLHPLISLDYLTRLFIESSELLQPYSDAQVDQGFWLLIGPGSDHAYNLSDPDVPWSNRLRCVHSILRLFQMFANRSSPHLSHLNEKGATPLNSICYMFWDILPVHGRPDRPASTDLNRSLLSVMKEILQLPSDACRESALHGLGHWQKYHPAEVQKIVDEFLNENPTIRPELRQYAENARCGDVR